MTINNVYGMTMGLARGSCSGVEEITGVEKLRKLRDKGVGWTIYIEKKKTNKIVGIMEEIKTIR